VGSRLVLVHGFTQTGRTWSQAAVRLQEGHEVLAPDVVPRADMWATAAALVDACGEGTWVGYSMGGRLCLHLALARPEAVHRLVLLGATAGIEDEGERAARVAADETLARSIERDGVDAFLDRWLTHPLFTDLSPEAARVDLRQPDPAVLTACLRRLGTGAQESLWGRLHELEMPVLCVAGERDTKFRAVSERMADRIGPNAALAVVPGAGHAAHLEAPDAFLDTVTPFLTS
jgi:2-succinyl-6-hydroxy-2,4-cyclohexadiene-1-carboxylate synthase